MAVFKLRSDLENYKTLHVKDIVLGDDSKGIDYRLFLGAERIGDRWIPPELVYFEDFASRDSIENPPGDAAMNDAKAKVPGDFPYLWTGTCPVLSQKAFSSLHEILAPSVEFLEVTSPQGNFVAFKVLNILDAIDVSRSEITWAKRLPKMGGEFEFIRSFKHLAFHDDRLGNAMIFRVPQLPLHNELFVAQAFVDLVENAGLKGFAFQKL